MIVSFRHRGLKRFFEEEDARKLAPDMVIGLRQFWLGDKFWKIGDIGIIDKFGPNGSAWAVLQGSRIAARLQTGYLYSYALVMLLGLTAAISWVLVH